MFADTNDVKQAANGRWRWILESLAPTLEAALAKPGRHVPCPVHGGKDGFRFFPKTLDEQGGGICNTCGAFSDGFAVLMWVNSWTWIETKDAVAELLGLNRPVKARPRPVAPPPAPKPDPETDRQANEKLRRRLTRIWRETAPLGDMIATPVLEYLRGRGLRIEMDLHDVRAHPGLDYWDGKAKIGKFPAMIALVRDPAGNPVTLHVTYVTMEGEKAPVPSPKKLMPYPQDRSLSGAAIRLATPGDVLGEAEGIETALAVMEATGMPMWSAVNATLLAGAEPPDTVSRLYLWGDRDLSGAGYTAVVKALERLHDRNFAVAGLLPPKSLYDGVSKSLDWLDVYQQCPGSIEVPRYLREYMLATMNRKIGMGKQQSHIA